jgi:hypothetical protein
VTPRVSPRVGGHLPPYAYINPPLPWLIHPISSSLLPGLAPTFWSRARELEETQRVGRRHAAGFLVLVFLLPLLCWTGAQKMSIHRACAIPQRRCSCGAGLHRLVQIHDLRLAFVVFINNVCARTFPRTRFSKV